MITHEELTCRELVELITDYLEGALSAPAQAALEEHLASCDGCSTYLEQMRTTIRLTGMLTEAQIPEEGKQELLSVFRAWHQGA